LITRPFVIASYTTFMALCSVRASFWITKTLRQVKLQQRVQRKLTRGRTALEESDDDSDGNFAFGVTNKHKKKVMNIDEEI